MPRRPRRAKTTATAAPPAPAHALSWSGCHIQWTGTDVVAAVIHDPTGVFIAPGERLAPDADREHLLEQLAAELAKPEGERNHPDNFNSVA